MGMIEIQCISLLSVSPASSLVKVEMGVKFLELYFLRTGFFLITGRYSGGISALDTQT